MSASGVGAKSLVPNFEGTKSSGDMNVTVSPANFALHAIGWTGSKTMVIKPKSTRQARGAASLETRMFACEMSKRDRLRNEVIPTPLRFPCGRLAPWRYFRPCAAPCNYRHI